MISAPCHRFLTNSYMSQQGLIMHFLYKLGTLDLKLLSFSLVTEKNWKERIYTVLYVTAKIVLVTGVFYIFICSLDLLADSFKLIGGKHTAILKQQI